MSKEIKSRAVELANLTNMETSYIIGPWWIDGFAAIRLPGQLDQDAALDLECQCGEGGCGCGCETCNRCDEGLPWCDYVAACPSLSISWRTEPEATARHAEHLLRLLKCLEERSPDRVTVKLRADSPACLVTDQGTHVRTEGKDLPDFQAHVQRKYIDAAQCAGATTWRFVHRIPAAKSAPLLLGYRGDELIAFISPMMMSSACKATA